ncbi:uncharacterized protein LOC108205453 [Daucus carota subsp. sativus]|uniref:uncharacterized protein LOC108205453 n=1 Tax=Daucus carota subsp. sativus TaxID=79200 RepID=UPI0007B2E7CD|nr:PREDICTED: uncharacterized protein LOC108205453 [Daucus carota subsp. sativus]
MGEKRGSIAFFTTYRPPVALDIYSCPLPPKSPHEELSMTDGESFNYDGHSITPAALKLIIKRPKLIPEGIKDADVDNGSVSGIVFVSERDDLETLQIAIHNSASRKAVTTKVFSFEDVYPRSDGVRMEDSPCVAGAKRDTLVYISTKEPAPRRRQPWTVVYRTHLKTGETGRLTPSLQADLSPSVSPSGKRIAVASYQRKAGWAGEIQDLQTSIYVMNVEKPFNRKLVVENGGWPTWGSEGVLFFHRKVDAFWAVFRVEFGDSYISEPIRVTPDKSNAMTPLAIDSTTVAVSMIRDLAKFGIDRTPEHYRHIIVFDSNTKKPVMDVTQVTKPLADHFNPFLIMDAKTNTKRIGYHRVNTGLIKPGENIERQFRKIESPVPDVGLFRLSGAFPTFSNDGKKVAFVDNEFKSVWVADEKGLRMVFEMDGPGKIFSPVWNQNKDLDILYVCIGPAFSADQLLEIHRIPNASRGRQHAQLLTDGFNNAFPSSNPEGTQLVFRSTRDHPIDSSKPGTERNDFKNLYIMEDAEEGDFGEGKITRLTEGDWVDTHCQWSPSGEWIVFSSTRDKPKTAPLKDNKLDSGYFAVYLVNPKHKDVVVRVFGSADDLAGHVNHPFFSPDGRSIVVTADLAGISVDPISLPLVEHSVRAYGDIFSVDIDKDDIKKNENVKNFKRITHTRYENSTATWTMFSTDDPNASWNLQFSEEYTPACPHAPASGAESWHMSGHLCIPKRCC